MSKRCTRCGKFLTDNDRFCPGCGENAPVAIDTNGEVISTENMNFSTESSGSAFDTANSASQNTSYQYQQQSAPPPYTPNYTSQYNPYPQLEEEMSIGKWVLTIFVTSLGLIGLIFLFVWGFGSGPKARQNYCKAMLIWAAIGIVLSFLMIFVYIGIFGAIFDGFGDYISDSSYTYDTAKTLVSMIF